MRTGRASSVKRKRHPPELRTPCDWSGYIRAIIQVRRSGVSETHCSGAAVIRLKCVMALNNSPVRLNGVRECAAAGSSAFAGRQPSAGADADMQAYQNLEGAVSPMRTRLWWAPRSNEDAI